MYLYTLELPKKGGGGGGGAKGHHTFMERGRTYMVQVLPHACAAAPSDRSEPGRVRVRVCVWAWAWAWAY